MEKAPGIQFNEFIDQMMKENKKLTPNEVSLAKIKNNSTQQFFLLLKV